MKINETLTEKQNIIKLANAAFDALEITVDVPEDESKVTITELKNISTGGGDGEESPLTTVTPNTSVKLSFTTDDEKTHETILKFKRLSLTTKKEKDKVLTVDPDLQYEIIKEDREPGQHHRKDRDAFINELKTIALEKLKLPADSPVTVANMSPRFLQTPEYQDLVRGVETYSVTPNNSLLTKDFVTIKVQTRTPDTGLVIKSEDSAVHWNEPCFFPVTANKVSNTVTGLSYEFGNTSWGLFLPYNLTEIKYSDYLGMAHQAKPNSNLTIYNVHYPKLKKITGDAFNGVHGEFNDVTSNYSVKSGTDHFFYDIDEIGDQAFRTIDYTVYDVEDGSNIIFGSENLVLGQNVFSTDSDFSNHHFRSLQSILRIIDDEYGCHDAKYYSNFEHWSEMETARTSQDNSKYGWMTFSNDVTIYFTAQDVTTNPQSMFTSSLEKTHKELQVYSKLTDFKIPDTLTTIPNSFLPSAKLDTWTCKANQTYSTNAFDKALIQHLIVEGDVDSMATFAENAFYNATINKITLKNSAVKAKFLENVKTLRNTPTYVLTDGEPGSEEKEETSEVPGTVHADGFKHNDEE